MGKDNEDGTQEVFMGHTWWGSHTPLIHMPLDRTRSHGHLNAGGWEMQSAHTEATGLCGHWVDNVQLARLQRGKSLTHDELEFKPRAPRRKSQLPSAAENQKPRVSLG